MANVMKISFVLILVFLTAFDSYFHVRGDPQVPCYFIFGDSLSDNGNNNDLTTTAKVNYPPYGIDFVNGPTGRFCNGQTMVDIIAKFLGFDDFIPSFASATGTGILKGVNYASGSAGIRDETGQHLGVNINMNTQLKHHNTTVSNFAAILGSQEATALLNKCLYSVGIGSNDYINNYFLSQYNTSNQFTPEQYADALIFQYSQQLHSLKTYGAKKVSLFRLGALGCTPHAIGVYGTNGSACVDKINDAVKFFNDKLKSLVDQLNNQFPDSKFIYVDGSAADFSSFKVVNATCCQVHDNDLCNRDKNPCPNRNEYLFWDSYHPTEAVNQIVAKRAYNAVQPSDAYPMDISHLVQL